VSGVPIERALKIQKLVRAQIIDAIEQDLDGMGEGLMKEVWEDLAGHAELVIASSEMRHIIAAIKELGR
jgi:hypothetical protein